MRLLLMSSQLTGKRSYEELARHTYGRAGQAAVDSCIIAMNVGSVVAYLNILTDTISSVAGEVGGGWVVVCGGEMSAGGCVCVGCVVVGEVMLCTVLVAGAGGHERGARGCARPPGGGPTPAPSPRCWGRVLGPLQSRLCWPSRGGSPPSLPATRPPSPPSPRSRPCPRPAGTVIPPGAEPSRNMMLGVVTMAGCLPVALLVKSAQLLTAVSSLSMVFLLFFCALIALLPFSPTPNTGARGGGWRVVGGLRLPFLEQPPTRHNTHSISPLLAFLPHPAAVPCLTAPPPRALSAAQARCCGGGGRACWWPSPSSPTASPPTSTCSTSTPPPSAPPCAR